MGDAQATLFPPREAFTPATPSGLTPNTRSEAEAALYHNTTAQTDSAAPTTPLPLHQVNDTLSSDPTTGITEAQRAYRRPDGPVRASSTNYANALHAANKESSASSDLSTDTTSTVQDISGTAKVASPVSAASMPFPPPGQGVVPLHTGAGNAQTKTRPSGLSLGDLGRKQSWSEQDMKHMLQGRLMGAVQGDAGYDSSSEMQAAGR